MLASIIAVIFLTGVCSRQGIFGELTGRSSYQDCDTQNRCVYTYLCDYYKAQGPYPNKQAFKNCENGKVCCPIGTLISDSSTSQIDSTSASHRENPAGFKCGLRNPDGLRDVFTANITASKSNEAEYGEFPWIIAILQKSLVSYYMELRFHCGGSLIHPRVVLTAAHYMENKMAENFEARAGEWEPHSTAEPLEHQGRSVKEIIIHERFKAHNFVYDGAILILESPFVISRHIYPICLPNAEILPNKLNCFVAGWGVWEFETNLRPQILKKFELQVHSVDKCSSMLRTVLGPYYQMHSSFICAGGEKDKDACTGDGGSALMCPFPNNEKYFYQAGIVSWGIGCGKQGVPGLYANVLRLRLWIDKVLTEKNLVE